MLAIAYYLSKVILCSGILYAYYYFALRNNIFHQYNRFYLLMSVLISSVAPLIKFNLWGNANPKTPVIHMIQLVSSGDEFVYNYNKNGLFQFDIFFIILVVYVFISAILLFMLGYTILKIQKLKIKYPSTILDGVNFRNTNAPGTPFSFFNNIFWNEKIDINTSTGKQIFQHELAHVREKHSHDKVFINVILISSWINPFFWIIRKELNLIHEFIADKKALENQDTGSFAEMILKATYPQQQFILSNHFFYSPIKRRLTMLTKNSHHKISYLGRLMVLPLTAFLIFAFTFRMKPHNQGYTYQGDKIKVIIDAGHGGDDHGALGENGILEKDIVLKVAKKIKELNTNKNLEIILSRSEDKTMNPKQRTNFANSIHANLFISLHLDAEQIKNTHSGLSVFIPGNNNPFVTESKNLGSSMIESFKANYQLGVENNMMQRERGIWILQANNSPAILIELGFITTRSDFDYLITANNQEKIAENILKGIENYAGTKTEVLNHQTQVKTDSVPKSNVKKGGDPLIVIDGVEKGRDQKELNYLKPDKIFSVNVLKGENALKKYGDKGKFGVIEVTTKTITSKDSTHDLPRP